MSTGHRLLWAFAIVLAISLVLVLRVTLLHPHGDQRPLVGAGIDAE